MNQFLCVSAAATRYLAAITESVLTERCGSCNATTLQQCNAPVNNDNSAPLKA